MGPGRDDHIAHGYSILLPPFFCSFLTLWGFKHCFIVSFFSLLDLEHESFTHVVGNISVAGDLVVSLCFS